MYPYVDVFPELGRAPPRCHLLHATVASVGNLHMAKWQTWQRAPGCSMTLAAICFEEIKTEVGTNLGSLMSRKASYECFFFSN